MFIIAEAMSRVEEMERERRKLDKQLDNALEKTKAANHGQEVLEAKIKVFLELKTDNSCKVPSKFVS